MNCQRLLVLGRFIKVVEVNIMAKFISEFDCNIPISKLGEITTSLVTWGSKSGSTDELLMVCTGLNFDTETREWDYSFNVFSSVNFSYFPLSNT
jgi:hypothetical protein